MEKARIDLNENIEKPFAVAGNVRGGAIVPKEDPFADRLQTFSGRSFLIKKYEFRVQK